MFITGILLTVYLSNRLNLRNPCTPLALNVLLHQLTTAPAATGEDFKITGRKLDGTDQLMLQATWQDLSGAPSLEVAGTGRIGYRPVALYPVKIVSHQTLFSSHQSRC